MFQGDTQDPGTSHLPSPCLPPGQGSGRGRGTARQGAAVLPDPTHLPILTLNCFSTFVPHIKGNSGLLLALSSSVGLGDTWVANVAEAQEKAGVPKVKAPLRWQAVCACRKMSEFCG